MHPESTTPVTLEDLRELTLPSPTPVDEICCGEDGLFIGRAYCYVSGRDRSENPQYVVQAVDFNTSGVDLPPFTYRKPDHTRRQDPRDLTSEDESPEPNPRVGYILLGIARGALRLPNHMHRISDAIVCALRNARSGEWETRFFPKDNIVEGDEYWEIVEEFAKRL